MPIDVSSLNKKQTRDLMSKLESHIKNIDKEKITRAKTKVDAVLKSEGLTFAQVYGRGRRGGKPGKVPPKYHNPKGPETWSGRGKRPHWFVAALRSGKKEKDLLIQ
jgi:DNA-binding protein H-NS